jgi:hypothetical protein
MKEKEKDKLPEVFGNYMDYSDFLTEKSTREIYDLEKEKQKKEKQK